MKVMSLQERVEAYVYEDKLYLNGYGSTKCAEFWRKVRLLQADVQEKMNRKAGR